MPVLTPLVPDLETAGSVGGVCLELQSGGVRFILSVGACLNSPGARPRQLDLSVVMCVLNCSLEVSGLS